MRFLSCFADVAKAFAIRRQSGLFISFVTFMRIHIILICMKCTTCVRERECECELVRILENILKYTYIAFHVILLMVLLLLIV